MRAHARGPQALRSSALHRRAAGGPHGPLLNGWRHAAIRGPPVVQRGRRGPVGAIWESPRNAAQEGGARSRALRPLIRRRCLSAESAANEASSATRPAERVPQGSRRSRPTPYEVLWLSSSGRLQSCWIERLAALPHGPDDTQELASQDHQRLRALEAFGFDGLVD